MCSRKPGSAGWYNSAAFDKAAKEAGLYSKSVNGDAFSDECRAKVIELIKADLGQVDMVVYSLASPVRKLPSTGELIRSALKPIGEVYKATAVDTNKDEIIEAQVEPASEEEIAEAVKSPEAAYAAISKWAKAYRDPKPTQLPNIGSL